MFRLDPAFLATSSEVRALTLCQVRLHLDVRFPWLVLIPRREGAREVEDLDQADTARLVEEIVLAGRAVRAIGEALGRPVEKLNIGALGNITAQLHVHVVGRRSDDVAWPGPVWSHGRAEPYSDGALEVARSAASVALRAGERSNRTR
jgi:diadenosine tetraphosphate (Ap4A) HIT family hydrolase